MATKFYINNVIVNRQGFSAFMHYLLDKEGDMQTSKSNISDYVVGVIDLGKYSVDPFFCDSLDPISMRNETDRIPGMNKTFRNIQASLIKEYDIRPKIYKVQKSLELNKYMRRKDYLKLKKVPPELLEELSKLVDRLSSGRTLAQNVDNQKVEEVESKIDNLINI